MPLPPRLFHPIGEIANRWAVSPIDIVGWAIDERIALSAALPLVETRDGHPVDGLVEISGQEVFDLFGAGTSKKTIVRIQRFRRRNVARWERIVHPCDGVPLRATGVVIARTDVERFERDCGLFGHHCESNGRQPSNPPGANVTHSGAPARYDWNAFAGAVARRVHDEGMPSSQGELVRDMLEWFAASGAIPDESTVRRRVQALWPVLTQKAV